MGMRGRDGHYKLIYEDFTIRITPGGSKYLEFKETPKHAQVRPMQADHLMWSTPNNLSCCPLHIFEIFLQKLPPETCNSESPFYLAVNYNHLNDIIWYKKHW